MAKKQKEIAFDPKDFLSRIGAGRTNTNYRGNAVVFVQGDAANAIYYLQKGKAKITVTSKKRKGSGARDPRALEIFSARVA